MVCQTELALSEVLWSGLESHTCGIATVISNELQFVHTFSLVTHNRAYRKATVTHTIDILYYAV